MVQSIRADMQNGGDSATISPPASYRLHHLQNMSFQGAKEPMAIWTKKVLIFALLIMVLGVGFSVAIHADGPPYTLYFPHWTKILLTPRPPIVHDSWRWLDPTQDMYQELSALAIQDWEQDGKNEVFTRKDHVLTAYAFRENGAFQYRWSTFINRAWGFHDWDEDGVTELWTLAADGEINLYEPWTMPPKTKFLPLNDFEREYEYAVVTDLFGQGEPVLLSRLSVEMPGQPFLRAYRVPNLEGVWEYKRDENSAELCSRPYDCTFTVAQVDSDIAQEIIMKNGDIIDSHTSTVQWHYEAGFKYGVYPFDVDNDGIEELLAARYDPTNYSYSLVAIDAAQQENLWQMPLDENCYPGPVLIDDIDDNGKDELLISCGSHLSVYDLSTRTLIWKFQDAGASGAIAVGKARNTKENDILWWGAPKRYGIYGSGIETFWTSATQHTVANQITNIEEGAYAVFPLELDGDPARELAVVGQLEEYLFPEENPVEVYDGITRQMEPNEGLDALRAWLRANSVLLSQTDEDIYLESIIARGPQLHSIDHDGQEIASVTLSNEWIPLWTADIDRDGRYELGSWKRFYGEGLSLRDARNLDLLWQTMYYTSIPYSQPFDIDGDGILEIPVRRNHTLIFLDGVTKQVDWSLPDANPDGVYGANIDNDPSPELIVMSADRNNDLQIKIIDVATKRVQSTSAPLGISILGFYALNLKHTSYPQLVITQVDNISLFEHPADHYPSQTLSFDFPENPGEVPRWFPVFADDIDDDGDNELLIPHYSGFSVYEVINK